MALDREVNERFARLEKMIRVWTESIRQTTKVVGDLKASIAEAQSRKPANGSHRFYCPAWLMPGAKDAVA